MSAQFEVGGLQFKYNGLGLDETFEGFELAAGILGPAIGALRADSVDVAEIAKALSTSFGKVPKLLRLFAGVSQVSFQHGNKSIFVDLNLQLDEAFKGKQSRAVLYVANCILLEYADFLGGGLQRVVSELEALFLSRAEQTASSGA